MSKRILIVEDERNLARFVSLELQHEGYDVVTADNGREGLEMALEKDFDLILLDLMLPEMDGFEVTRRLQQEKDTYIIMMTARDSIMDIVAGLDRGADEYIIKPFAIEENHLRLKNCWHVFVQLSVVKISKLLRRHQLKRQPIAI